MAKKKPKAVPQSPVAAAPPELPPGVKLVRTLRGHTGWIGRIAWSPDGRLLASPSLDKTIRLWDTKAGECLRTLTGHSAKVVATAFDTSGCILASASDELSLRIWDVSSGHLIRRLDGHHGPVTSVAFDPSGRTLATASRDRTVKLWDVASGKLLHTLHGHEGQVNTVCFHSRGDMLASASGDRTTTLWEPRSGQLIRALATHPDAINSLSFAPKDRTLASACSDKTVKIWDGLTGQLIRSLEGHTAWVKCVAFSPDGRLLASKGSDDRIRLWRSDTGAPIASLPEPASQEWPPGLAFHPGGSFLATVGSDPDTPAYGNSGDEIRDRLIHIWELDLDVLLHDSAFAPANYISAKVVLVGDSGVGKTGLGWKLAHGEYKEHSSTHGQQFWPLKQLCKTRTDGAQCEAVLWDLAGQPDYRLIHALFLDDADLALMLFDPTCDGDPLAGIEFWLKQLKVVPPKGGTPTVLVAARSDRGTARLTQEELDAFCKQRGLASYLRTSARNGEGVEELIQRMQTLIPWDEKPTTVTTETFKRVKDFVLDLKKAGGDAKVILTPEELRHRLEATDAKWKFSDAEMLTAVGHLANHGYVTRLKTSRGEPRILLAPELLNNLAASFVLEGRRQEKGLGSLEEQRLLAGQYAFPEIAKLAQAERDVLVDSAAVLFLEHNVCFRETDPFNARAYLVFPELINLKKPIVANEQPVEDGVAYTAAGAVENVYASLVVLLGYTQTFIRTNQWANQARYEVANGLVCGFRLEAERAGELDFVLYFDTRAPAPIRMLFQSLFESFLARRNLTVRRFDPVACPKGHQLNRAVVREQMSAGALSAFCNRCGAEITLPKADQPIQLTQQEAVEVERQRRAADQRSRFEQVLFRLKTYVTEAKIAVPECFISFACGNLEHERWVEHSLATDLLKAGIKVVLDRWDNAQINASIPRFVERVAKCDRVIVVGTPLYRTKYENKDPARGTVVAAEGHLIGNRMLGTDAQKLSVLPILVEGTEETSFPALLHGRVYADFRRSETYTEKALDLLLSLYEIKPRDPVAIDLRESLRGMK